jgi:hypothetical protein
MNTHIQMDKYFVVSVYLFHTCRIFNGQETAGSKFMKVLYFPLSCFFSALCHLSSKIDVEECKR